MPLSFPASCHKEIERWRLPFFVTRALTPPSPCGLAFPCQGIPTGNFKVGIKGWWMLSHFSQAAWRAVCMVPVLFMQKKLWKIHYYFTENIRKKKKISLLPHHPRTSCPCHVLVLTLLRCQACVPAIGNAACSQGQPLAPWQPLCALWYSQNCLANERPQEPLLLQKCILLIFEHHGSLESNFSIRSPCVYTENAHLTTESYVYNKVWGRISQWIVLSKKTEETCYFCIIIYDTTHALKLRICCGLNPANS